MTDDADGGQVVPVFTLKDQDDKEFKIAECRGRRVLLSFHPLAWTAVCAKQMQSLESHRGDFEALNAVAVGISVDSSPCKRAWAESLGIQKTRLLSDFWPHGGVARSLGIFREENGFSERANILLDEEGRIVFKKVYPIKELPDIDKLLAIIKGM